MVVVKPARIYKLSAWYFAIMSLIELIFVTLVINGVIESYDFNGEYIEVTFNILIGFILFFTLYKPSIWGLILAVVVIPLESIYSIYSVYSSDISDYIGIYGFFILSFHAVVLGGIVTVSHNVFPDIRWLSKSRSKILILPKGMALASIADRHGERSEGD